MEELPEKMRSALTAWVWKDIGLCGSFYKQKLISLKPHKKSSMLLPSCAFWIASKN
ncbi:hypothetical protein ADICYQ_2516 [Cyclobacterium qasimii M12-11B]|uniref:Uncharacterized protein n=1 Tax=Cyclobacterium qasimii M12-11B TaxID=641524 RepID=S7VEG5_9BACT|nr:hypothetical protein ADICYQ_2516 [Cyclobacterium qasimii M12-11B]